jgi:hypothetical protein
MRKRINRHIENCAVCGDRKRRELAPALLLGLAPLAALPIAAMPAGLRAQVLRLASSNTPEALAHRADAAQRTALGSQGFPKPVDGPKPRWRTWQAQSVAVGTTAAAVVIASLALTGGLAAHHGQPNALGSVPGGGAGASTGPSTGPSSVASSSPGRSAQPTVSASGVAHRSPGPSAGNSPALPGGSPGPSGGSPRPSSGGSPSATAPSSGHGTSPAPSRSTTPASTPSSAPPPPRPGTLSVTPTSILLSPVTGGSLTLTASGGPVSWSVTEPSSLIGRLTVVPSAGTLASGQSVTVSLSVSGLASVDSSLTVSPGGTTVTVLLGVG